MKKDLDKISDVIITVQYYH